MSASAPKGSLAQRATAARARRLGVSVTIGLSLLLGWSCQRGGPPGGPPGAGPSQEGAAPGGAPEGGGGEGAAGAAPGGGPPGMAGGRKPQVTVVTLEPQEVRLTRELPGRVRPFRVAEVRPRTSGIVAERTFTEGTRVEEGDVLYVLDDETMRANVQSAQGALARARAGLKVAQQNAKRSKMLFDGEAISAQQHDVVVSQLELARADTKSAQAALDAAKVALSYSRVTAPISGRIGKSTVTEGALVTTAQPDPLVTVQQLDPIYVDVTQSASELLALRQQIEQGQLGRDEEAPVTILLEDGTRYEHPGKLRFADVTVDPSTGSFSIRVEVLNPEHLLLPGMYVRAVLGSGVRKDGLLVPQQGVTRDPTGQATALVVDDDGKVAQRELETVQTVGSSWLVESGLAAGDRVIVQGLQKVQPGVPVEAVEAEEPEGATGGSGAVDGGMPLPPGK